VDYQAGVCDYHQVSQMAAKKPKSVAALKNHPEVLRMRGGKALLVDRCPEQ
jgi:hypothetical protein